MSGGTDRRLAYIKAALRGYVENKRRLKEMTFDGLEVKGERVPQKRQNGRREAALVAYLDKKRAIEKKIELVDRVVDYYDVREHAYCDGKAKYLRLRFLKGMSFVRVGVECVVGGSTAAYWLKDVYVVAAAIADMYSLW